MWAGRRRRGNCELQAGDGVSMRGKLVVILETRRHEWAWLGNGRPVSVLGQPEAEIVVEGIPC